MEQLKKQKIMYVIKVKDKNLFASAQINKKTIDYINTLEKAQIYYSNNSAKIRKNIVEKVYGACEIREVEIKLK